MVTWFLIALLAVLVVVAYLAAGALGEMWARRDVPLRGDHETWLEGLLWHARSGTRRARLAWWRHWQEWRSGR